jgi:WXXGXW repeat (2 copies)
MNMKNFLTSIGLLTIVLIHTSCAPAFVSSEPTYVEVVRPKQPSTVHVWVGDGWAYNRNSRSYVQRNGYWAAPRRGRAYHQGYWRKSNRGSVWVKGHW